MIFAEIQKNTQNLKTNFDELLRTLNPGLLKNKDFLLPLYYIDGILPKSIFPINVIEKFQFIFSL